MNRTLIVAAALSLLAVQAACKPPRSPRERAAGSVTGEWTARSAAPGDSGRVDWRLAVEERDGGRVVGEGTMGGAGERTGFPVSGVRGESEITLYFDLPGGRVKYHGGVRGLESIVGELYLPADTVPVTFTRR